jgi:hypothetical protein
MKLIPYFVNSKRDMVIHITTLKTNKINLKHMPTQTFDFFIDRKITTWVREFHQLEAESLDDAKAEMAARFHDNLCVDTFDEQETLFDTEEYLEPGDNGGNPTAELYSEDDGQLITTNIDLLDSK